MYLPANLGLISAEIIKAPANPKPVKPTDKTEKMELSSLSQPAKYMPSRHPEYPTQAVNKINWPQKINYFLSNTPVKQERKNNEH